MSDWQDVCAALALLSAAALFGWLDWRIFAFYRDVFLDEYSPPAETEARSRPQDESGSGPPDGEEWSAPTVSPNCEIDKSVNLPASAAGGGAIDAPIDAEPDCEIDKSVNAPSPDDQDATRSGLRRRGKAAPLCRSSSPH